MHKHIPHFMHHFRVPPEQRSPPSSSPASLSSHICTSRPPFPAEQLPSNSRVHLPAPQGCQAAEPTQHPRPLHSQLPSVLSDRCRCEPTRNSSCQVRCSGDTVRQRGAASVPGNLSAELLAEPPTPRTCCRHHLGSHISRTALSCSHRHNFRI